MSGFINRLALTLLVALILLSPPALAQFTQFSDRSPDNPALSLPPETLHFGVAAIQRFPATQQALSASEYLSGEGDGASQVRLDYEPRKLSAIKAIGLSALLPGAGQWYAGRRGQARLFFGIEAANWIGYAGLKVFANWRRDDFVEFAVQHAGINLEGQDDEFFRLLNFYENRDDYNAIGRAFDPDAPFFPDTPELQWNWDSPESQATYRQLRNDFQSAERDAEFMFVTAAINRLVSSVLAWQAVKRHNRRVSPDIEDEFGITKHKPAGFSSLRLERLARPSRPSRPAPGQPASEGLMLRYRRSF